MQIINTDEELILSLKEKDFDNLKKSLDSLNLSSENAEIRDYWFSEGVWIIETDDNEKFIVIFGKSQIHLILKKTNNFEQLKTKFLNFLNS